MLTNNNNTSSSAPPPPPPPPPLPPGNLKNWKLPQDNGNSNKPSNVATSGISSRTEPKKGQSNSPVQQSHLNLKESPLFNKIQQKNNVDSEIVDAGSNTRQSESNRTSTPESVSSRVLSPQQDNGNSNKPFSNSEDSKSTKTIPGLSNSYNLSSELEENNKPLDTLEERCESNTGQGVPQKPMTEQYSGVQFDNDKPGEMKCESKNQKSSVAEQKKATTLKYSIAILLLCTSGAVAGVCTYFVISAVLSGVAVPVLFAVIASVSALVMFSSAAYLINSHLSAINSEKGVDPNRKQPQYSDLQKAKELEHSNTPTSSLPVMSRTPIVPPPPPSSTTVKPNDLSTAVIRKSSTSDANQKDVQQKQSGTPVDARSNLLAQIGKGITLKKVPDEEKSYLPKDDLKIPQKQEEESTPGKQENGVQTLNQNQPQNSGLQEAKKLEHSNSDTTTGPIRKVESQKTDKEPSNSEGRQQTDNLRETILERRKGIDYQDEQSDSLEERDDSLCSLEGSLIEPNNTSNKELKNPVQRLDVATVLSKNVSTLSLLNSPINNLSSNSANVPDDEDWPTQPDSILDIYTDKTRKQERVKDRDNYPYSASSPTKMNNVELASSDMQDPSTVSVKDRQKIFE